MDGQEKKFREFMKQMFPYISSYEYDEEDRYKGEVFGRDSFYDPAQGNYRIFHKNFMKALSLIYLENYKLINSDHSLIEQIVDVSDDYNYALRGIACHSAIILLVSAMETFLKDNFIMILKRFHKEKIGSKNTKKIIRQYSFQNLKSIEKAFSGLCQNFRNSEFIYSDLHYGSRIDLVEILKLRNKIVHESFFDPELKPVDVYRQAMLILFFVDNFDLFFEREGYYSDNEK